MKHSAPLIACSLLMTCTNLFAADTPKTINVGLAIAPSGSFGLTFIPPNEDGWISQRSSSMDVTLKKNASVSTDNRQIEAYVITLDSPVFPISNYIETIKQNVSAGYANNKKFKVSTLEIKEHPNNKCVTGHLLLEGITTDQTSVEKKWSEQYFLSCGSAKYKGMGVELRYYHRYTDSTKDNRFGESARRVLESVELNDI